jgi:hypothetical protein
VPDALAVVVEPAVEMGLMLFGDVAAIASSQRLLAAGDAGIGATQRMRLRVVQLTLADLLGDAVILQLHAIRHLIAARVAGLEAMVVPVTAGEPGSGRSQGDQSSNIPKMRRVESMAVPSK